jgi:hypothetical protein
MPFVHHPISIRPEPALLVPSCRVRNESSWFNVQIKAKGPHWTYSIC